MCSLSPLQDAPADHKTSLLEHPSWSPCTAFLFCPYSRIVPLSNVHHCRELCQGHGERVLQGAYYTLQISPYTVSTHICTCSPDFVTPDSHLQQDSNFTRTPVLSPPHPTWHHYLPTSYGQHSWGHIDSSVCHSPIQSLSKAWRSTIKTCPASISTYFLSLPLLSHSPEHFLSPEL